LNNLCCFDILFIGVSCLLGGENSSQYCSHHPTGFQIDELHTGKRGFMCNISRANTIHFNNFSPSAYFPPEKPVHKDTVLAAINQRDVVLYNATNGIREIKNLWDKLYKALRPLA
jgi:hypothetical protein